MLLGMFPHSTLSIDCKTAIKNGTNITSGHLVQSAPYVFNRSWTRSCIPEVQTTRDGPGWRSLATARASTRVTDTPSASSKWRTVWVSLHQLVCLSYSFVGSAVWLCGFGKLGRRKTTFSKSGLAKNNVIQVKLKFKEFYLSKYMPPVQKYTIYNHIVAS